MSEYIGAPIPRIDGQLKVTGGARYAAEIPLPRMAHAVLVPSTIASGQVDSLDDGDARQAAGVLAVISFRNAPRLARPKYVPAGQSMPILQGPEIYYAGQPIAVVVADTLEHATHAASLVHASYTSRPPATDMERLLQSVYQPEKTQIGQPAASRRGDVSLGLQQAVETIHAIYRTPIEHHNAMEPHATVAVWERGNLTVYDATQGITNVQEALAQIFGIDKSRVRVVSHFLGGGFGSKGQSWPHTAIAALAARQVGRPVKLVLTRPQMFFSNGHRPQTVQTIDLGATRDGKLTATRHDTINHTSPADDFVETAGSITEFLYSCPNVEVTHRLIRLNTGTPTFDRAPGFSTGSFALECAMDELAAQIGMDPIELRLRNYAERDEHENLPWSSKSLRQCYEQGAEHFGWKRRKPGPAALRDGRWLVGYGMASAAYPAHFRPSSARATMFADGTVVVQCGTQELGTGTYTVMSQVAARALAVPVARVRFELGDTRLPPAPLSAGSATVASAGSSVYLAALALRDKLIRMAVGDRRSPLAGTPFEAVEAIDGRLQRKDTATVGETYQALLGRQRNRQVSADASAGPEQEPGRERPQQPGNQPAQGGREAVGRHSSQAFGAQFCEVRVDPQLGEIRVARMTGCFGCGRILNARTAHSQLLGGMVWGIGMALTEETRLDLNQGRFTNANLADYLLPVNADVPAIEVLMVEEHDPYVNPIGAKGMGEIGIVGAAAAIANAVYHATGKRIRDLPLSPEKLFA
ncbi:MAG: xanthine dehydrogenase family protein molybdopterin-binding subunit [Zoogloea sp.]|nr:xanthine dehydrogenase family protein molybdopterin-binding subunit [Zoogloea sp.]